MAYDFKSSKFTCKSTSYFSLLNINSDAMFSEDVTAFLQCLLCFFSCYLPPLLGHQHTVSSSVLPAQTPFHLSESMISGGSSHFSV